MSALAILCTLVTAILAALFLAFVFKPPRIAEKPRIVVLPKPDVDLQILTLTSELEKVRRGFLAEAAR
jgi:hypothetical protein